MSEEYIQCSSQNCSQCGNISSSNEEYSQQCSNQLPPQTGLIVPIKAAKKYQKTNSQLHIKDLQKEIELLRLNIQRKDVEIFNLKAEVEEYQARSKNNSKFQSVYVNQLESYQENISDSSWNYDPVKIEKPSQAYKTKKNNNFQAKVKKLSRQQNIFVKEIQKLKFKVQQYEQKESWMLNFITSFNQLTKNLSKKFNQSYIFTTKRWSPKKKTKISWRYLKHILNYYQQALK